MNSKKIFSTIQAIPIIWAHTIAWILYLLYSYLINLLTYKEVKIHEILALNIPLILFFYSCLYGFRVFKKNVSSGILYFLGISGILFGLGFYLIDNLFPRFGIELRTRNFSFEAYAQEVIIVTMKFFVYALLYFVIQEWTKSRENLKNSEIERLRLEDIKNKKEIETTQYQYAFLRSQVNPHFLYNTLNVLFSQALKVSQPLADSILKLSDVMRYSLDGSEENYERILLRKEIDQLNNVIDIFQLRFSDRKQIKIKIEGEINDQKIPPLSLITIVENAFKYGELNDPEFPLEIKIYATKETVSFNLKNKKKKNTAKVISNTIGMNNLKQRLEFSYPGKYILNINDEPEMYRLYFEIKQN